jgi:hypothetical protein
MIVIFFDSQLLLDARRDEISVFFLRIIKKKNTYIKVQKIVNSKQIFFAFIVLGGGDGAFFI